MNEILDRIIEILKEHHEDVDYSTENQLVSGKLLDSFDLVTLVAELSDEFDIEITGEDFIEENFNSAAALAKMVERLLGE